MNEQVPSKEKIILNTDPEAAREITVTGWVSRDGLFFGKDERAARWSGCTHIVCECGKPTPKTYTRCEECRNKLTRERWLALPLVEWDGESPIVMFDDDRYFWSTEDLLDWCYDEDIKPSTLMLVTCEPHFAREIDADYWSDDLPEDGDELPDDIAAAVDALNKVIRAHKEPLCWHPGKQRVVVADPEVIIDADANEFDGEPK